MTVMNDQEKQTLLDDEHLRLLRIGYIVSGAADAFFALFPLIYVVMGIFIAAAAPGGRPGEPNPALFGLVFVLIGLAVSFMMVLQASLKLYAARSLGQRRQRVVCYIAAAMACLQMPWGIMLGVFSFMVLSRESVKNQFEEAAVQHALPPSRMPTSLFDDEGMHQREREVYSSRPRE